MSLNFAAISPHPPIIIPEIGGDDTKKASETTAALEKLGKSFNEAEIETLIVISPHSLIYPDRFNICGMENLKGDFTNFKTDKIKFEYKNNLVLAAKIDQQAQEQGIQTLLYNNNDDDFELDHGISVPLYYLQKEQESAFRILPIAYSSLSRADHFSFGELIGEVASRSSERIGILASGDLSHRLVGGVQGKSATVGKEFDQKITEDVSKNKLQDIIYYDEEFVADAGECGYNSFLILAGALSKLEPQAEFLSYEGPFGVGYMVANFKLKEK